MLEDAILALQRGDHAAARAAADAVLTDSPGDVEALRLRGLARFSQGDADGARTDIEAALARAPGRGDLHMALASMAMSGGQFDAALAAANEAVEADPNHLPAYVSLAHMAMARGDEAEAGRMLKLAQRVSPTHPQTLLAQANLAQVQGQPDVALALLVRVVEMIPEDRVALASLAQAYLRAGNFAFAEQAARRAIELHGATRRSRWVLVAALRGQSRFEDALEQVDALLAEQPDAGLRAHRAVLLIELGRLDEAMSAIEGALAELGPDVGFVRDAIQGLVRRRRPDLARTMLDALLERHRDLDLLWRVRVSLAPVLNEDPGQALQRWLEACPDSAQAVEYEAMRLEALGELEPAARAAARALDLDADLDVAPLVLLRAHVRDEPAQALDLADSLLATRDAPEFRRTVLMWKGLAADRLERPADAVAAWAAMAHGTASRLPSATRAGGDQEGEGAAAPVPARRALLWGLPGSDVVAVAERFRGRHAIVLLADRFSAHPRRDGLDLRDGAPPAPRAAARAWKRGVRGMGADPEAVIDWLPHWNPLVDECLPGNRLVCVLRDPRDLLLNWWVFGSVQRLDFPGPLDAARWLATALDALADRVERAPADTLLLRTDAFTDAGSTALDEFLASASALAPAPGQPASFGGHTLRFEADHWRGVAGELEAAFAVLEAPARRLGY